MTAHCRATQVNDQMICPCGKQWDVSDPEPPKCGGVELVAAARHGGKPHVARAQYLQFIERVLGAKLK